MKRLTLSCKFAVNYLFVVLTLFATYSAAVNELQFDNGNFNVSWNYLPASQEIEFEVRAKTTGYVALGLTKTNSFMQNLDLFAGGVNSSGNNYLKDYKATGRSVPLPDSQQDYNMVSANEANGETTVRCKRKLNTQDVDDQLIKPGDPLYIAWAYHTSSDDITYHSSRGYSPQMLVLVPVMTTSIPTPSPTAVGPTSETTSPDLTSETPTTNMATATTSSTSPSSTSTSSSSTSPSSSSSSTSPSSTSTSSSSTSPSSSSSSSSTSPSSTSSSSSSTSPSSSSSSSTSPSSSSSSSSTSPSSTSSSTSPSSSSTLTTSTSKATAFISTNTNTKGGAITIVAPTTSQAPSPPATVSKTTKLPDSTSNKDQSFNNGDFLVYWKFDSNTNELFFKLVVKAAGWVGLGISNTNSGMTDMDVVVTGVSGGQGYIGDYYSTAKDVPPRDTTENYILRTATESGGKTTVEFKRKMNTGDDKDLQIVPGEPYYIAWAYHSSRDTLTYHSQRGYSPNKVILAANSTITKPPPTTEGSVGMATYSVIVVFLSLVYTLIVH